VANSESTPAAGGPVRPTAAAAVAHRPPRGGVRLTGGLLGDWQQRNRDASMPRALRQMETAGNLHNLRLAIAGTGDGYRGPAFMDSDLYKTLEAIGWELGREAAPGLAEFAAESTWLLEKAQQADGYLNSYVQVTRGQRYARLASSHELYCAGHLIQAAVAADRTFDGGALLQVARRFADHLVSTFLGGQVGLDGHPIIETALVELYRETGTPDYLALASQFVDQRGRGLIGDSGFGRRYLQDHLPVRESPAVAGHAVRALYLEAGVVDVAAETGDGELLASSVARWDDMVATKTALTGGNGSRHSGEAFGDSFELPPDRAYNETCAAIASFQWSWRLLLATGDGKYADLMERVLYNGFGASLSADGQQFFYVNPLQRRADHFENDDPGRRRGWFSCACCPPNIMRLLASLQHYVATVAGDVLHLHHLAGSQVTVPLAGGTFSLEVATGLPWAGSAELRVTAAPAAPCGLAVRVPSWSRGMPVSLNGQPLESKADDHGYLLVRRRWQAGDVLTCTLDVRPRLTYPAGRIDAVRGSVAVERGPLVYCFEQADQPAGVSVEDLVLSPAASPGRLTERAQVLAGVGHTVVVEADALHVRPAGQDGQPGSGQPGSGQPGSGQPGSGQPGSGLPYSALPDQGSAGRSAVAVAIPYFQWDNRDGQAMRVWMPAGRPAGPAVSDLAAARRAPLVTDNE
jgi:DUF1680 family protein